MTADPGDYEVAIDGVVIDDADYHILTSLADTANFEVAISHKASGPPTPYPASGVARNTIAKRDPAPTGITTTKASSTQANDGTVALAGIFEYRAHTDARSSNWISALDAASVTFGSYDVRTPATSTAFASALALATVGVTGVSFVTYDANSGTSAPAQTGGTAGVDNAFYNGGAVDVMAQGTMMRTGYEFEGWDTVPDVTFDSVPNTSFISAADATTAKTFVITTDTTLTAQWSERDTYTVVYDLTGGTSSTITAKAGVKFSDTNLLPFDVPVRAGWDFAGWYTGATSDMKVEATHAYGDLVADDTVSSATVYAHWTQRTDYTVVYDLNGATSTPIKDKTPVKFSDDNLLPTPAPTYPGWDFMGWYTEAAGGMKVLDTTPYFALVTSDAQTTLTLYARWQDITPPTATISYRTSSFTSFLNAVTFHLFFKQTVDVTIQGSDLQTGVAKVEWLTAPQSFADAAAAVSFAQTATGWIEVSGALASFNLTPADKGKLYVFARVTDNAGNVSTTVYFDGVVIYADTTLSPAFVTFERASTTDVSVNLALNGNTVTSVTCVPPTGGSGGGVLAPSSYTIDETSGTLVIDASYLKGLVAGTYSFEVAYDPQGTSFAGADIRSDTPAAAVLTIDVIKSNQPALTLEGLGFAYTYGDGPVAVYTQGGAGSGDVSYTLVPTPGGAVDIIEHPDNTATLTFLRPGSLTLFATKAGDATYNPQTTAVASATVSKATPPVNLSVTPASTGSYGDDLVCAATVARVNTGAVPTGTVDFFIDGAGVPAATVALDASGKATFSAAHLVSGPHSFVVAYSGNTFYKGYGPAETPDTSPDASAQGTFTIGKAAQTIAIADPGHKTYGDADFTLTLSDPGSGIGNVTYTTSPSGILSLSGDTATITGTGIVTICATKSEDVNYNAASATITVTVAKAVPVWDTSATGTAIEYGHFLYASSLSGHVVRGVGTHAADTISGILGWTTPLSIPDVSTVAGTPATYAVAFIPTGSDANNYTSLSGTAALTVTKATPQIKTPPSATPILMAPDDTLVASTLTGGNAAFVFGTQPLAVDGTWSWTDDTISFPAAGTEQAQAVFTPADTSRFNTVTQMVDIHVFSPKTVITQAPTASAVRYGDRVSTSVLDSTSAHAQEDDGSGPGAAIDGTWAWSHGDDRIDAPVSYTAEVTFTPDVLAPVPPVAGSPGHLPSTVDVAIPVLKAIPVSLVGNATDTIYGHKLSTSLITRYLVTGVFGETVMGDLVWTTPDVIPSDALGEVGVYTASVIFTPTGSFAACYEATTFTLDVRVVPDTTVIDEHATDEAEPLLLIIHEENYTTEALEALRSALDHANLVRTDVRYTYTQADVEAADATLVAVMDALVHDHPVLAQTPQGGVTTRGQAVTVEIKGYLPDVTSLDFAGHTYTLVPTGDSMAPTFDILDGSTRIGTVTSGSAVVTFTPAFIDTFANGSYELRLGFNDHYELLGGASFTRQGEGIAQVVISRAPVPSGSGPTSTAPKTGDSLLLVVVAACALLVVGGGCVGVGVGGAQEQKTCGVAQLTRRCTPAPVVASVVTPGTRT
jgi:uncharacterized repeat protein (TIGR02543 family)